MDASRAEDDLLLTLSEQAAALESPDWSQLLALTAAGSDEEQAGGPQSKTQQSSGGHSHLNIGIPPLTCTLYEIE